MNTAVAIPFEILNRSDPDIISKLNDMEIRNIKSSWNYHLRQGFLPERAAEKIIHRRNLRKPQSRNLFEVISSHDVPKVKINKERKNREENKEEMQQEAIKAGLSEISSTDSSTDSSADSSGDLSCNLSGKLSGDSSACLMWRIFSGLISLGSLVLLIHASAQVYGHEWDGWTKAILLEVGIVSLFITPVSGFLRMPSRILGGIGLLISLGTMGHGVKFIEQKTLEKAWEDDLSVNILTDQRQRLLKVLDATPSNFVTKRFEKQEELDVLNKKILDATQKASQHATASHRGLIELSVRIFLVGLAAIFGHVCVCPFTQTSIPEPYNRGRLQ